MKTYYSIFYLDHGTWRGPYDGVMYNTKEQAEKACKFLKSRMSYPVLKSKIKIMKQLWVDIGLENRLNSILKLDKMSTTPV